MNRRLILLVLGLLVASCVSYPSGEKPTNSLYCDNIMVYEMCVTDLNGDGEIEFVYFEGSQQAFMYRPGALRRLPKSLSMHPCATEMDEEMVRTTSRMFYIDESTTLLEKTDIRGTLLLRYMTALPEITACNLRREAASDAGS